MNTLTNLHIAKRVERVMEVAQRMATREEKNWLEEIHFHYNGYAEPGYTEPESGIIATGTWMNVRRSKLEARVQMVLRKLGVELLPDYEWTTCNDCSKLIRTEPDNWDWVPSAVQGDACIICHECLDPVEYLKDLEGNCENSCIAQVDPSKHGYVKVNEESYETGFHSWQKDRPEKVGKELIDKRVYRFLFKVAKVGQFDAKWDVYVHESENHLLGPEIIESDPPPAME